MFPQNKIYFSKIFFSLFFFGLLFSIAPTIVKANSVTVTGYAWSSNIGWIKFNHGKTDSVMYDTVSGKLSGYAWSNNIGWIYFGPNPTNGTSVSGRTPPNWAKADTPASVTSSNVSGWARACAGTINTLDPKKQDSNNDGINDLTPTPTLTGDCATNISRPDGWDGWIKFDTGTGKKNPVSVNFTTGEFHGYAWGSDVVGWISFNCAEGSSTGGSICGTSNYKGGTSNYKVSIFSSSSPLPICNSNGIQDNGETGIDCGGGGCPSPCIVGGGKTDGACGTATNYSWDDNGPTSNLCSSSGGNTTPVKSGSDWTWTCPGSGGGAPASCSAGYNYNPETVNLTLDKTGNGTGNVKLYAWRATPLFTDDWNDYGQTDDNDFQDGETHDLAKDWWYKMVATPDSGSYFNKWSNCSSSDPKGAESYLEGKCFVTMDANKTVTVTFDLLGGGGGGNDPTAYIDATKNPVPDDNTTVINWSSDNATSCQQVDSGLGSGGYKDTGWLTAGNTTSGKYGTKIFTTSGSGGSRTYTINCSNGSKTSPDASVTVNVSNVSGAPSVSVWADPQSIGYKKTSLIKWLSSNIQANKCSLLYSSSDSMNGYLKWYGVPPYSLPFGSGYYVNDFNSNNTIGQTTGKLASDTTYKIQCGGYGPSYAKVTAQTTVAVAPSVSDFTFTNITGAMTATIVEGLSANSSSATLAFKDSAIGDVILSASIPKKFTDAGAKAQFSADDGKNWSETLPIADISITSQVKLKVINIPGNTATGTYNVAVKATDTGNVSYFKKLNVDLQVKKVSSEWQEF